MDTKQALDNLHKAVRTIQANAETHEILAKSVQVIKEALEKINEPKE